MPLCSITGIRFVAWVPMVCARAADTDSTILSCH